MTGINASKLIQNLQVLYNWPRYFLYPIWLAPSFFFSASLFFLISDLENGTKLLPLSPAARGGWRAKESLSPPQYGTQISELGSYVCRSGRWLLCLSAMNTNSRNWGPRDFFEFRF